MIKRFVQFTNETIQYNDVYPWVLIKCDDDSYNDTETSKLNIIRKYFPFDDVKGVVSYVDDSDVELNFDSGKMTILGKWNGASDTLPVDFYIGNKWIGKFNWHPFDGMGGVNIKKFEESVFMIKGLPSRPL